ncbi:MAG TPA: 16S rRNA (cytidine(1402)-2'-O)-methyltransferase [Rhodothermales bacterium]|nr:16S rRNA (cytidine(1402)-2'-O)-methyltransferase [Rhodothermales bacterium]
MLYIVPTPIGNLEDITLRALRILREADVVACEDTRTSGVLLQHYQIETSRTSFHAFNEAAKADHLIARIQRGETVALISDAGTPGISDPGFSLVRAAIQAGVSVEVLPGATAFVPALVASGLPSDRFVFEGFLPVKKGRQTRMKALVEESRTMVFYESPHRIQKTLDGFITLFGPDRPACVARELSKKFEEVVRGSLSSVRVHFSQEAKVRGEFVLIIGGKTG